MKPRAYVVHRLPGRVRLRVPERRNDRRFFDEVERRLRQLRSVKDVRTNPATGSILVEHKGEIADVAKEVFGSDVGELVDIVLSVPPVARRLRSEVSSIDGVIQQFTGGEVDLRTLASLGLLAMAAIQLVGGEQPALAVSLSWYATELLRRSAGAGTTASADRADSVHLGP